MSAGVSSYLHRRRVAETAIANGPLSIGVLSDRREAGTLWRRIEAGLASETLTAGWDWTESWLDHYGDEIPHRFVVATGADGPCGIALITRGVAQRRGPLPVRTRHLGTAGERPGESACVEYNRLLIAPRQRVAFLALLIDHFRRDRLGWDIVELNGFDPSEIEELRAIEPGFTVERRVCHVADLKAARDAGKDLVDCLPGSVGSKVRKNVRKFEERYGPLSSEWIDAAERVEPVYDELVRLHQARWTASGHPGSFSSTRFRHFHRQLIARLLPSDRAVLFRVMAGAQVIGIFYGFAELGSIYHYQWGLEQFDDNALSPGFVVGALLMREASARGYDEVNWLAGDVRYKRELSTTTRELAWAQWHRGPWSAAVNRLIAVKHWWGDRHERRAVRNGEPG